MHFSSVERVKVGDNSQHGSSTESLICFLTLLAGIPGSGFLHGDHPQLWIHPWWTYKSFEEKNDAEGDQVDSTFVSSALTKTLP